MDPFANVVQPFSRLFFTSTINKGAFLSDEE